jgi:2-methylcitrate dehydratase PrpD
MVTKTAEVSETMKTLSAHIAGALGKPLPEEVTECAKLHLLDTLAAIVSGSRLIPGKRAIGYIKTLGGTREACVIGTRIVTTAVNAALANGMFGHADETDDSHAAGLFHPGTCIVPAALALAERNRYGGTALLRAMVLGYPKAVAGLGTLNFWGCRSAVQRLRTFELGRRSARPGQTRSLVVTF